ncbi:sodium/glutamate symporter [Fusobacterium perfoetens]|uniref:sodium/glutamate symporter n=1 Tax=Fusobacterium perfoetens TaxID=852 RepID=UPI00047FCF55|nr:sodium/glutamate symporter [Fusobacterium perfoetens]MCI6153140.1 sodium/glutamate symporter [Fusobacterium perfoetens]MDY3237070.1 sodium/glutamate symporter [Fusobacterium perfoetens]
MLQLKLDIFQTLAFTVLLIWLGNYLRNKFPILKKYCIPSSVVGGLLFAIIACVLYVNNIASISFDSKVTNNLFYCVFFAASGAAAGMSLLRKGGKLIFIFTILAAVTAFLQNVLAVGLGRVLNVKPLIALMTGSIPMTGGHGNAASFAPIAEEMGAVGAMEVAIAAATFGLISGCIIGGPLGNAIVQKYGLKGNATAEEIAEMEKASQKQFIVNKERSLKAVCLMFIACGFGSILFGILKKVLPGVSLPIHVLCMLGGLIIRIFYDSVIGEDEALYESIDIVGEISLAMFVTMSIMTMKLWQLADLAIPMIILLFAQVALMALFATLISFRLLGKDYDAAIMAVGHTGFGLGAVPVSMATMKTVCDKYGYSKIAFFVVPVIGGLISNFTNAAIITFFLNFCKNL